MRNEYETCLSVTTKPIETNTVVLQQVLHVLLRAFDHWIKIIVHLKAGLLDWSESSISVNKCFLKNAKEEYAIE